MSKTLPISEVKTHLPALVTAVAEQEEEVVVTRNGKPAAVLVNYDEGTMGTMRQSGQFCEVAAGRPAGLA